MSTTFWNPNDNYTRQHNCPESILNVAFSQETRWSISQISAAAITAVPYENIWLPFDSLFSVSHTLFSTSKIMSQLDSNGLKSSHRRVTIERMLSRSGRKAGTWLRYLKRKSDVRVDVNDPIYIKRVGKTETYSMTLPCRCHRYRYWIADDARHFLTISNHKSLVDKNLNNLRLLQIPLLYHEVRK